MKQTIVMKTKDMMDRRRLLFSAVVVLVLLLGTWAVLPMVFETNDDLSMMGCLAGAWTGKPEADTVFSLFLWGKIVSFLYIVNAGMPWYTMIFLGLIFLSLTTVCYCLTVMFPKWGKSLFCLLYFCVFIYYSVVLQFTVVSAFCGVAVLSLLLTEKKEKSRRDFILKNVIISFFLFFAINIRDQVGYLTLASAAFVICLEVLRYLLKAADRQKLKRMAVSFLVLCAVAGVSLGAHKIHESRNGWEDFREFNSERVQYIDYLALDYTSNQDLFDRLGWSEDFYNLVNCWFFMDETVNAETFRMINERKTPVPMGVKWALSHDFPRIGFQAVVWVLIMLVLLSNAVTHGGDIVGKLVPLLWLLVWLAETWYFAHSGRLMERAFEAWTLLAVIPSVVGMGASENDQMQENERNARIVSTAVSMLMLLLCIVCIVHPHGGYRGAKAITFAKGGEKKQSGAEDYAIAHSENVYVYDLSYSSKIGGGGVWRTYAEETPYNLVFWGGSRYSSPLYYKQLERNGLEHLYVKDFFRENVYMLAAKEPNELLVKVMQEKFPSCTYEITEERDEFIVYQFRNEE